MPARLSRVRGFLIDMDGTLYIGPNALPGAVAFMGEIRTRGLARTVLTNNSSRDGLRYVERLRSLGIEIQRSEVLTSGDSSAEWLAEHSELRRPFVLGTGALRDACLAAGLTPTGFDDDPDCVLLGYDTSLTYETLTHACLLVARGLPYYATHADRTCIDPAGLLPDAGAFIAAIETTTGRTPEVLGKPMRSMLDAGLRRIGTKPEETLVVGDQLDTDISLGRRHGVLCALVLTGETSRAQLEASEVKPDLVYEDVGALLSDWLAIITA